MGKSIELLIPEPCHEDWDKMTPTERGRFCYSCQKQVVDFTNMSDEQLALFFKKPVTGSVCGRFMQHQLGRTINIPKKRIPWVKYFFQFALPAFLVSAKAMAQGQVKIKGDTVMVPEKKRPLVEKHIESEKGRRINGKVTDENGEGISFATVSVKGTMTGTVADSTGNFSLQYRGDEDSLVLVSSCVGYYSVERVVNLNMPDEIVVISNKSNEWLSEVVVAGGIYVKGKTLGGTVSVIKTTNVFEKVFNNLSGKNREIKLYPNPVNTNKSLMIECNTSKNAEHVVQLVSMNGQIVYSKEISMAKDERFIEVIVPGIAAGVYFVNLVNKQTGKTKTAKLIVE